jgi:hypothetical protein
MCTHPRPDGRGYLLSHLRRSTFIFPKIEYLCEKSAKRPNDLPRFLFISLFHFCLFSDSGFNPRPSVGAISSQRLDADVAARVKGKKKEAFSMPSLKQRCFNEHLLELFISKSGLDRRAIKNHPHYEFFRNYATSDA